MKITKETIERLIEEVKDYDQDTGIHSIEQTLQPSRSDLLREYRIKVYIKSELVLFDIDIYRDEEDVYVGIGIGEGMYYTVFDPIELEEEPISLPQLLRTLFYLMTRKHKDYFDRVRKEFEDTVLYED